MKFKYIKCIECTIITSKLKKIYGTNKILMKNIFLRNAKDEFSDDLFRKIFQQILMEIFGVIQLKSKFTILNFQSK